MRGDQIEETSLNSIEILRLPDHGGVIEVRGWKLMICTHNKDPVNHHPLLFDIQTRGTLDMMII